ncbi:TPA: hypothetical protein ACUL7P_001344 [Haemophilus influenzae]|nr:hypothetical protein BV057_00094 [Haemophilus influenzae]
MSNRFDELAQSTMSENDLDVVDCVFKVIAKYGFEEARAVFAFERAKRELLAAYEQKMDVIVKVDRQLAKETFTPQDVKMMGYALAYIKKAGITQFEKEFEQIKLAVQTENHIPV